MKVTSLDQLNPEINSYSNLKLITHNKQENKQLIQIEGQIIEALGLLEDAVDTLKILEPKAVEKISSAVLTIFECRDSEDKSQDPFNQS